MKEEQNESCSGIEQDQQAKPNGCAVQKLADQVQEPLQEQKQEPCKVCGDDPTMKEFCGECGPPEADHDGLVHPGDFAPPPLFGRHETGVELQREHTHHRAICYLVAQGLSNVEVAKALNLTPPTVAYTKKQDWAKTLINELQDQFGRKNVMMVFQEAAVDAAKCIAAIATGKIPARPGDQVKAGKDLLDRLYGTAQQNVHHTKGGDPNEMTDAELAEEIKVAKKN